MLGAFALTETDAGSDASAIRTRAVKVDGGYRLSGSKQFITSAQIAGIAIVYAVTDPAAGKRGISGFIVPTDAPGYRVDKVAHKRSEEHTSELQSLMRISYAVICLIQKKNSTQHYRPHTTH